jgi:multiple sugar transport system permease protein
MDSIPSELIEASRLDGASEFGIFHRIILPLLGPALSSLTIFIFISAWDDFLWPFLMLTDSQKYTLPIGLALFQGKYWTDLSSVLAGASIATIPVVILYIIFQKRIIEGITLTGLK